MKENKKVSPSLGVCGRNSAATGRKLLHFALCFLALFTFILPAEAIDWASYAAQPNAGSQYYIFSYIYKDGAYSSDMRFLTANGITENPNEANLFTLNGSGRGSFSLNNQTWSITASGSGYYCSRQSGYSKYYLRIDTEGVLQTSSTATTGVLGWRFIPKATFDALPRNTLYYTANAAYASASQSEWGTIKVSANNSTWVDEINKSEGEQTFGSTATVYYKATPASDLYRFLGWKTSPEAEDYISTNATYAAAFDASTDENTPTSYTLYAVFEKGTRVYYTARTEALNKKTLEIVAGTSPKASFENSSWNNRTQQTAVQNKVWFPSNSGETVATYHRATNVNNLYSFAYWKTNAENTGSEISGASNTTYTKYTLLSSLSDDSNSPTTITMYAYFTAAETIYYRAEVLPGDAIAEEAVANGGVTLKASFTANSQNSGNWTSATDVANANATTYNALENKTAYFKETVNNTSMYQFKGWKENPSDENYISTAAFFSRAFDVSSRDNSEPDTKKMYAFFGKATTVYAKATTGTNIAAAGTAKVAFSSTIPADQTEVTENHTQFADSYNFTAYFEATAPAEGYEFAGWSRNIDGTRMIGGAVELTYHEPLTATGTKEDRPTSLAVYAIYKPISAQEAQRIYVDALGEEHIISYNLLSEAIAAVQTGDRIQLLKNVSTAQTINKSGKSFVLDINGYSFSSTTTVLYLTAGNVTIEDSNPKSDNGIRLSDASAVPVIEVAGGKLTLSLGRVDATNSSVGAVLVSGGEFAMEGAGGEIVANAGYGVQVNSSASATLAQGTINATNGAIGVIANGAVNITHSIEINVSGATNIVGVRLNANATIDGGVISATATGANAYAIQAQAGTVVCEGSMEAKASATSGAYALKQEGTATVTVNAGRFWTNTADVQDIIAATASKLILKNGYYVNDEGLETYRIKNTNPEVKVADLQNSNRFYTAGYRYVLSDGVNPNYVAFTANGKGFSTLEEALDYANQNPNITMTILQMVPRYTLESAGNYTLPANATLLIPYKKDQTPKTTIERTTNTDYVSPTEFRKLIFSTGVHLDVLGTIEVGCKQSEKGQTNSANGAPTGPFGWLYLSEGSQIVVSDGGIVRAWGFITGPGEIDIRRGGVVWEQFQILDFKGGSITSALISGRAGKGHRLFPISQYFIQNIESKTTYHPGARLFTQSAFYMSTEVVFNSIQIIGVYNRIDKQADDIAMFLMDDADNSEDTWVRKSYDVMNDYQVYEINSSAKLGSMTISGGGTTMNSQDYDLPITHNMKIHLLTGKMDIGQRTVMLPGAKIEINKQSTVVVVDKSNISYDGALFLYDANEWGQYIHNNSSAGTGYYAQKVKYTPSIGEAGGTPTARWSGEGGTKTVKPASASINVRGTLEIEGALYTTASGANIYSTNEDAGTVHFLVAAANDGNVYHANDALATSGLLTKSLTNDNVADVCTSAQLKNGDGSYTPTKGYAGAGDSYCYINGEWRKLVTEGCIVKSVEEDKYFAKPQGYVELVKQRPEKGTYKDLCVTDEHTYEFVGAPENTVLICMDDCQWWEVVPTDEDPTIFHCTHPQNDTYYYWGEDADDNNKEKWLVKQVSILWKMDDSGENSEYYYVPYKSVPKYNGSTPTKQMTSTYIYDFVGWTPKPVPATEDATYTAVFTSRLRSYFITFRDADGVIESKQWAVGSTPVCTNAPAPTGKILQWEPAIHAVTGAQTYTATYLDEEPTEYPISFINHDGAILQAERMIPVGEIPVYEGLDPTKEDPTQTDKDFVFIGWEPAIAPVTEAKIYVATYSETPKKFTITFLDMDGITVLSSGLYEYGSTPVCTNPPTQEVTEEDAANGIAYYEVVWDEPIGVVTSDKTYTVEGFAPRMSTCLFNLVAGENGKVKIGTEDPAASTSMVADYGTEITITALPNENYVFVGWSDANNMNPRTYNIKNTTLRAEFALAQYTITWKDYAGVTLGTTIVNHGETPSYPAPARAADQTNSYSFAGWNTTKTPGNAIVEATADATYYATYTSTPVEYTLRFIFDNGREDFVKTYGYNVEPVITNPTKTSQMGVEYVFTGWKNNATEVITEAGVASTTLPAVTGNASYTAQYLGELVAGGDVAEEVVLDDPTSLEDVTIHTNGSVEAYGGAALTVNNLYLEATSEESGQLLGSNVSAVNAYFDWTMNGTTGSVRRTWYAVAVPWEVNAETGILDKATERTLVAGRDFDLIYYSGADRAANGNVASNWQYVQWDIQGHDRQGNSRPVDKLLHPGRLYMMYFAAEGLQTVRFVKADGAAVMYTNPISVETYAADDSKDANWNGIANPRTYYATIDVGNTYAQVLNNGNLDDYFAGESNPVYQTINLSSSSFMVGKPLFVQAVNATPVVINKSDDANIVAAYAPRRARAAQVNKALPEGIDAVYQLTIAAEGKPSSDNLFVQVAEDEKADKYVIGKDLSKGGVAAKRAQMWVDRYNTKLSVNTQTLVNDEATYPLVLFVPVAGDYTISTVQSTMSNEDYDLYLTLNGEAIWNLSNGEYTLSLPQGNTADYGLRISARKSPTVATGIDEAVVDAKGETQKVLINNQVFIIRGDKVYSVDGQLVK